MKKDNEKYISNFSLFLYGICQRFAFIRKFKVILYYIDFFSLIFIKKPKKINKYKKDVLVIYNYAFGDGIIFMTSGKNLRKIYPSDKYNLHIICQRGLDKLYKSYNIFDEVIPFDLTKSTFNLKVRYSLFKKLREKYYDIVLDPIGVSECTTNVFMSRALCASEKITILDETLKNKMCPKYIYNRIYTKIIKINKEHLSLLEFYNSFINELSNQTFKVELENINSPKLSIDLPKDYYILFPSASTEMKRYPIERYASIVKRIYNKTKLPLVITGTKVDENSYNELLELIKDIPVINIIGKTSLMEFVTVIKESKFVITNDTSTYHIAYVNQVPVSIITGVYTYDRYVLHKFDGDNSYKKPYIIVNKMECMNCDNNCKKRTSTSRCWPCLESISLEYAWKIIEKMIDENYNKKVNINESNRKNKKDK